MTESSLKSNSPEDILTELNYQDTEEIDEQEWLHAAARTYQASEVSSDDLSSTNSAFDFLNDPQEDIYTLADGKPFFQ